MKDKTNKPHSPNQLVVLNPTIVHDDHKNSEEKEKRTATKQKRGMLSH
mgnify:CR=1 FL=1